MASVENGLHGISIVYFLSFYFSHSKKIQFLGTSDENQPHPQKLRLQRLVRNYAANYLQENMFTAPSLPTRDQYEELVRKHDEDLERQRQEEKQRKIASSLVDKEVSPPVRSMYQKEAAAKGSQKHGGKTEFFLKAFMSGKPLLTLSILSFTVFLNLD